MQGRAAVEGNPVEDMVPLEGILPDQGWPGRVEGSSVAVEISKKNMQITFKWMHTIV